jgi:hypothetical protein
VKDLAAAATGTDWPAIIARSVGLWASGHFDRGQALWTPRPGQGAYAGWCEWATHDLTPEIAGLTGFSAYVAGAPDTAERSILRAAERLKLARFRLLSDGRAARVGDIAADLGFTHMGRFSSAYRTAFGETPRDTLARGAP